MKKFDLFLMIIACGLVSFGFYFSKKFKSDVEYDYDTKTKNKITESQSSRIPSQQNDPKGRKINSINENDKDKSLDAKYKEKYLALKKCILTQDCDFPQDDPRSYELAIYQSINEMLQDVGQVSDDLKEKVLISAARMNDGYIKETVIKQLLKDKMHSPRWRDLVLSEYVSHHNARLIPQTVEYLKAYDTEQDKVVIHTKIFTEISNGSPKVANALAENLEQLLDEKTATFYKSQISNLKEGPIKTNLTREITDFEMMSSAG